MTVFEEFWNSRHLSEIAPLEYLGTLDTFTSDGFRSISRYMEHRLDELRSLINSYAVSFITTLMLALIIYPCGTTIASVFGFTELSLSLIIVFGIVTGLPTGFSIYYLIFTLYYGSKARRLNHPCMVYKLANADLLSLPALLHDDVKFVTLVAYSAPELSKADAFQGVHDYYIFARKGISVHIARAEIIDTGYSDIGMGTYLHELLKRGNTCDTDVQSVQPKCDIS